MVIFMKNNPMQCLRRLVDDHYGDFDLNQGKLTMTFSREASGEGNLRLIISDILTSGAIKGDPAALSHDLFGELEHGAIQLTNNMSISLNQQNNDLMIVEIDTIGLTS